MQIECYPFVTVMYFFHYPFDWSNREDYAVANDVIAMYSPATCILWRCLEESRYATGFPSPS
jgi:hypothetical protein